MILPNLVNWFKPDKKRKSYSRARYYEEQLKEKLDSDFYRNLFDLQEQSKTQTTTTEFDFRLGIGFGMTVSEVMKKWGKPHEKVEIKTPFESSGLFYRLKVFGINMKCEMHFIQDKLYVLQFKFDYLSEEQYKEVYEMLNIKYVPENSEKLKHHSVVKTPLESSLIIEDGINLKLNYISGDLASKTLLTDDMDRKELQKRNYRTKRHLELMSCF